MQVGLYLGYGYTVSMVVAVCKCFSMYLCAAMCECLSVNVCECSVVCGVFL